MKIDKLYFMAIGVSLFLVGSSQAFAQEASGPSEMTPTPVLKDIGFYTSKIILADLVQVKEISDRVKFDFRKTAPLPELVKKEVQEVAEKDFIGFYGQIPASSEGIAVAKDILSICVPFKVDVSDVFKNRELYILRSGIYDPIYRYYLLFYNKNSGACSEPYLIDGSTWVNADFEDLLGKGQKILKIAAGVHTGSGSGGTIVGYYRPNLDLSCREVFGYISDLYLGESHTEKKIIKTSQGVLTLSEEDDYSENLDGTEKKTVKKKIFRERVDKFDPEAFKIEPDRSF